jgi:putative ATPase
MRPTSLKEVVGQARITKTGSALSRLIEGDPASPLSSIILWGPPGSGKTTLARLISQTRDSNFVELSAISATVANVREVIDSAKKLLEVYDRPTILFLDEIHRFSKSQQDSLLSAVESGLVTLIAATTENPSFSIIKPLVSRCLVLKLEPLTEAEISTLLSRAIERKDWNGKEVSEEAIDYLAKVSSGDARRALTLLEAAAAQSESTIDLAVAKSASEVAIAYDATGDAHYDTISAFIKSVRGSDVDSAIHYLARMIAGGEDPRFIARRLMILAAEDIGLADPNALVIASAGADVVERIGIPEGRIPLAEVTIYLATAPKSNRAYLAINKALAELETGPVPAVPAPLRSTGAVGYQYPHDDSRGIIKQKYSELTTRFYEPSNHGFEKTVAERLKAIREILEG